MEYISKNEDETKKIAFDLGHILTEKYCRRAPSAGLVSAVIVGLYGDLGSGKTTFMKYLAEYFGVIETVQSPTFVIMKRYDLTPTSLLNEERGQGGEVFKHLIHIDAYRIEKESEMLNLGWQEIISDSKNLICIEWPERLSSIMPNHIKINFEHLDDENERKINISI